MPIELNVLKKYKTSNLFIETGSYLGEGIDVAIESGYDQIYSIELSDHYYNFCLKKFNNNNKIKIIKGCSEDQLPILLKNINSQCDFWLDAHYSMGNTALGPKICPLYEELESILKHRPDHTIIIDDVRFMDTDWWENISKDKIINFILSANKNYKFYFENGYQQNDILVAKVTNED